MELKNEDGLTEKEFLAQYRPGNYERPSVTVDMLIFAVDPEAEEEEPELLLIRRRNHPCVGQWAIPGGFVNMDESLSLIHISDRTNIEEIMLYSVRRDRK